MPEIAKRTLIWITETLSTALLLSMYLVALAGAPGSTGFINELLLAFWVILLLFMLETGYLLTTVIFGVFLRGEVLWRYPAIAATLLVLHLQFAATGWDSRQKIELQIGGACIVAACTLAGGWCLQKWR